MGIDYRPALFLSVRGVKEHVNSKSISYEEFTKSRDYFTGITENVQRTLLPFDYLEVEAIINEKEEIIKLTALDDIRSFSQMDEQEFLKEMNDMAYLELCEKINGVKKKVITLFRSENKKIEENIDLLLKMMRKYEKHKLNFVDWFTSNHFNLPIIPKLNPSIKSEFEKIISINRDDKIVRIENFHTLELIIPKHLEPRDRILFRLRGNSRKTDYIKISQIRASFLTYLAFERKESSKLWLRNPEDHHDTLFLLYNKFELPEYFEEEIHEKPKIIQTWIYDFHNEYRKKIKSHINSRLLLEGNVKGTLLNSVPSPSYARQANYTLVKTIVKIDINKHPI